MTLFRRFATLAFSASVLSACGPQDPGSDVNQQGLKTGGYSEENSNQAFGGVIAGQTVTGLFYVPPTPGSMTTGWWVSTATNNQYAPVVWIKDGTTNVTALSSTEGGLMVQTAGTTPHLLQGTDVNFQMEVGAPLNALVRITSSQSGGTHTQYVTEWTSIDSTSWSSFCPHPYTDETGETNLPEYMIPVGGANWSLNGSRNDNPNAIQLSCTHDSVGGCIRWGYTPWGFAENSDGTASSQSLANTHQACTRMKRADFCGTGDPTTTVNASTFEHTTIQLWDKHDIHSAGDQTRYSMEAHWGVNGAICVNPTQFRTTEAENVRRMEIQLSLCPKPACTDTKSGSVSGFVSSARVFTADGDPGADSIN